MPLSGNKFDHATWVTMTNEGPKIANLLIYQKHGIQPPPLSAKEKKTARQKKAKYHHRDGERPASG